MNNFNLEALHDLVKRVAVINEKLIYDCIDEFYKKSYLTIHFLNYDELIEVCEVLNKYTDFCTIDFNNYYNFTSTIYFKSDLKKIPNKPFSIEECDCSDYTIRINNEDWPELSEWYVIFFTEEFWEFCNNFINENEENMNNKIAVIEKETFSLENIYNIAEHSDKIIHICDELEGIGFNNEEIFEIITNIIKKIG